jgi:hypothetical protein
VVVVVVVVVLCCLASLFVSVICVVIGLGLFRVSCSRRRFGLSLACNVAWHALRQIPDGTCGCVHLMMSWSNTFALNMPAHTVSARLSMKVTGTASPFWPRRME